MNDLIGFISIALVSLMTVILALKKPEISRIIYTALALRVLVILIGNYLILLPDSTKDADGLEYLAWSYGKNGFLNTLDNFPGMNSFFYSWLIGVLYSIFGRSIMMAQSFGLMFGVGTVYLGWILTKRIWDNRTAIKVAWLLALYPSLILYSVLTLREVYSSFFLLVAMYGIFNWVKNNSYNSVYLTMFGFIGATFFHGALILGGIVFLVIILLNSLKKISKIFTSLHFYPQAFFITILAAIILQFYFLDKFYIPKIGYFSDISFGYFINELKGRMIGGASYGEWAMISTVEEFYYKLPLRVLYFLFAPFPWDIQKPYHLIGMFDGLLYLFLFILIIRNIKVILKDPFLRIMLIILLFYFLAFGFGVSNFGAGLRHRTKFTAEIIILAGPFLPMLVVSEKNKLQKIFKINFTNSKKNR